MKSSKILLGIISFLLALSIANALQYNVELNVLPIHSGDGVVGEDENFLVFGYVQTNDERFAIKPNELKIKVIDSDGNVEDIVTPYYVDKSGSDFVFDGYFYKMISIEDSGDYVVRVEAADSKDFKFVNVKDSISDRLVSVKLLDYSIKGDEIKFGMLVSNNDSTSHTVIVELWGENNFEYPTSFSVDVAAGETVSVEKEFPLKDFGESKFIVAAQAHVKGTSNDELYSSPSYTTVYVEDENVFWGREQLEIKGVEIPQDTIFPGDLIEGKVYIENKGTTTAQYKFEYTYDNQVFSKGEVGYVEPGQTAVENFFIQVPDKDSINVEFRVYNEFSADTYTKSILISHKLRQFFINLAKNVYTINESGNFTAELAIVNTGNLDDIYSINVSNWSDYRIESTSVALAPDESTVVKILFEVPSDLRVGTYTPAITVCNVEGSCEEKELEIDLVKPEEEQSMVSWNETQDNFSFTSAGEEINYTFSIKNIGNAVKTYSIEINASEGLNYTLPEEFNLGADEERNVTFTLIPTNTSNYTAEVKLIANGEEIFTRRVTLNYASEGSNGFTGMLISSVKGVYTPGLIMLSLIGVGALIYITYYGLSRYMWTEKVLAYNRQHPQQLTGYPKKY